jgi:hypothetical protein
MKFSIFKRGVSLYLALIIMFILIAIALGVSLIIVSQMKMMKGMGDSVVAFYAADTGIEQTLYQIRVGGGWNGDISGSVDGGASYYVTSPASDTYQSKGSFAKVKRAIEISLPPPPPAGTTRYLRSDTHSVNGLTGRKLDTDLTGSVTTEIYRTAVAVASADFGVRFFRRLADGTEVEIISSGTPIIVGTRIAIGDGLQSVDISVPEIALNSTDAIIVRCYYRNPATTGSWSQLGWTTPNWITPRLNATKLSATTWTVYLYTLILPSETVGKYDIGLGFGSSDEQSRIDNFVLAS